MPDYRITGTLANLPSGVIECDVDVYSSSRSSVGYAYVDVGAGTNFEIEVFLDGDFWLQIWAFDSGGVVAARLVGPYDPATAAEEITPL